MKKFILSSLFTLIIIGVFAQDCKIEVKFANLKNQDLIIGHHFNAQLIPDDTITLDNKGYGAFKGKEAFPGGMYFLFLPNKTYFDFILDKDQEFSITGDTMDFDNTVKYKGSVENTVFTEYQRSLKDANRRLNDLSKLREANKGNKEKIKEIDLDLKKIREEMGGYHKKAIAEHPNMFFTKFLKATRRVEVPKEITDKKEQYYYFRNHYFDPFDISDPRLLRTPIYKGTIDMFLDKVIMQHPDTLITEVDMLIEKSRTNDELFRFMLVHLFNKYASSLVMSSENVYVHIADKYYINEAKWSKPEFISELKTKIKRKKKCLIGASAPDINFRIVPVDTVKIIEIIEKNDVLKTDGLQVEKSDADSLVKINLKIELLKEFFFEFEEISSLYTTETEYTILWFWTPDCSHCKKETPKFYELYLEKKLDERNVKIISVYMQKDIADWKRFSKNNDDWFKFIKKHNMDKLINAWNPFDLFRRNYDLDSSPVLYLLDKEKKIVAKRIGYEQAIEIIDNELKSKNK